MWVEFGVANRPTAAGEGRKDALEQVVDLGAVIPTAESAGLERTPQLVDVLRLGWQWWARRLIGPDTARAARTALTRPLPRPGLATRTAETTRHRRPIGQVTGTGLADRRAISAAVARAGARSAIPRVNPWRWRQAHLGRTVGVDATILRTVSAGSGPTLVRPLRIWSRPIRPLQIWTGSIRPLLIRTRPIRPLLIGTRSIRARLVRTAAEAGRTAEGGVAVARRRVGAGRRTVRRLGRFAAVVVPLEVGGWRVPARRGAIGQRRHSRARHAGNRHSGSW